MRPREKSRKDMQRSDDKESQPSQQNLEHDFANNTSLHGLDRIANPNKPIWLRFLWLLAWGACFGVCVWQITSRLQAFLEFDANTLISVEYDSQLTFPAVTICNFNR